MVADRDAGDAVTEFFDNSATLMAEDGREQAFGVLA